MNIGGSIYHFLRRRITFREWEVFYREILAHEEGLGDLHLSALLRHIKDHVPYYSEICGENHAAPRLSDFPILSKQILEKNFEALRSTDPTERNCFLNSSGGSTGRPQTFVQDKIFQQWSIAAQTYYFRRFLDADYAGTSKVILWGSEKDFYKRSLGLKPKFTNWLTRSTFLNSFKVSEEQLLNYLRIINRKKPEFIKGYAGSLYQLAKAAREGGIRIHSPRFIYSAAETLRPFMRATIEDVFGCKVFDFYGSREVGAIAGECREGKLHIFDFNNHLEIVDNDGSPVAPGGEGRVLVTTLHNHSMPLLRYAIGDTAVVGNPCSCGSVLPTLERVTGRLTDHFLNPDGDMVHGEYFTHLFYFRDWIEEFQVLQKDLDLIQIYFVPKDDPDSADVEDINEKIRLVMGNSCILEWIRVEEVPRTPQGKLLYTRSLVNQGEES